MSKIRSLAWPKIVAVIAVLSLLTVLIATAVSATDEDRPQPSSGYAAVGTVDTEAKKAEVLLDDGRIGAVIYTGEAPKTGAVHWYAKDENNVYTFTYLTGNHNNSDQLTADGWVAWFTTQGWFWDGAINYYFPSAEMPIFIRNSATSWSLTRWGSDIAEAQQAQTKAYFFNCTARDDGAQRFDTTAVMIGSVTNGAITAPADTDLTQFVNAAPADLSAFTADIHPAPAPLPSEPSEPAESSKPDAPVTEVTKGYAAVGAVNANTKKANILLEDGRTGIVSFVGTAPTTGAVHAYSQKSDGTYAFTLLEGGPSGAKQLKAEQTGFSASTWNGFWTADAQGQISYFTAAENMPVYIRYSATSWRVVQPYTAPATDYEGPIWGYLFLNGGSGSMDNMYKVAAIMIGSADENGIKAPSATDLVPFGGDAIATGNADLSAMEGIEPEKPVTRVGTGICAVGEIKDGHAMILKADGKVVDAKVRGGMPTSGELHTFTLWSDDTYSFALAPLMPGAPTASYEAWNFAAYNYEEHPHQVYAGDDIFRTLDENSAFFVRYSATDWRVVRGKEAVQGHGIEFVGYLCETEGHVVNYMLIGNYDVKNKKIIPAKAEWSSFLDKNGKGWSKGNISLTFGSVKTGAETYVSLALFVAAAAGFVCLTLVLNKKKKEGNWE